MLRIFPRGGMVIDFASRNLMPTGDADTRRWIDIGGGAVVEVCIQHLLTYAGLTDAVFCAIRL